jgi:hypothetical protein
MQFTDIPLGICVIVDLYLLLPCMPTVLMLDTVLRNSSPAFLDLLIHTSEFALQLVVDAVQGDQKRSQSGVVLMISIIFIQVCNKGRGGFAIT